MRKYIPMILTVAVLVCTFASASTLMGCLAIRKNTNGPAAAQVELDRLMAQAEDGTLDIDMMSNVAYMALAHKVSELVERIGSVTEVAHYFRNRFTRAPGTLDEMIAVIRNDQGGPFGWKLMSRKSTRFHMYGADGEYNMKFVSADGHFEAVYNRDGCKLTAENDPMNMGTFNYGDPLNEKMSHTVYDIMPFFEWGNAPEAVKQTADNPDKSSPNDIKERATRRFELYWELLYGEKPQEASGNGAGLPSLALILSLGVALKTRSRVNTALTEAPAPSVTPATPAPLTREIYRSSFRQLCNTRNMLERAEPP